MMKRLGKRIFVRDGNVNRRHWNIQHPQIDGELPAMVIVMIHEDRANDPDPRDGHQYLSVFCQAPRGGKPSVVHFLQGGLRTFEALIESVQDFLAALGLRLREVRDLHTVRHDCCSNAARHGSDMQGQLAQRIGFRVGFPGEFVFRNSIQDSLRRFCFLFKRYCTFDTTGQYMNNGPVISSNVGRLMACPTPQKWPLSSPRSRYHLPPGHASSFIGMGPPSGTPLYGPNCSRSAVNVTSSDARTWISSVMPSVKSSILVAVEIIFPP